MSEHTLKLNPMEMKKYVDFLELKATELQTLCKQFDEQLIVATQCMDQLSGQTAAARLTRTMKQVSQNIPRTAAAAQPIVKASRLANDATKVFSKKFRSR